MKTLIITATILSLTACTTSEMVAIAADECAEIGYKPSSAEYTQCTERGYRQIDAQQDAAVGAAVWWAILEAAY